MRTQTEVGTTWRRPPRSLTRPLSADLGLRTFTLSLIFRLFTILSRFSLYSVHSQFTKKRKKKPTKAVVIKKRAPVVTPDPVRRTDTMMVLRGGRKMLPWRDRPASDGERGEAKQRDGWRERQSQRRRAFVGT